MKRHDIAVMHSSKRSDWRTPPELFEALDREFHFAVDVAADEHSTHCPHHWFGPGADQDVEIDELGSWEDGLAVGWHEVLDEHVRTVEDTADDVKGIVAREAFFMNPPYCRGDSNADPPILPMPIAPWIKKAWEESKRGCTVVGVLPFGPQTEWFRAYVYGHGTGRNALVADQRLQWNGHAAMEVRPLPHRVCFVDPDTGVAGNNANVNTCIVVWRPNPGFVGPWQPAVRYWTYR